MPVKSVREMSEAQRRRHSLHRRTLQSVLVASFLLCVTAILIGYRMYAVKMDEKYMENTSSLAQTTAVLLDSDSVERCARTVGRIFRDAPLEIREDQEGEEYRALFQRVEQDETWIHLRALLQAVKERNDIIQSMQVVVVDRNAHAGIYVADSDTDEETYCPPGAWDEMSEEEVATFEEGGAVISNSEEYGWLSSGGCPLYTTKGRMYGFVLIDISMNDVMRERHQFLLIYCLALLAITIASSVVLSWALDRAVVLPINKLAAAASDYAKRRRSGDRGPVFHGLDIHTGDELENLYLVMRDMEGELAEYIEDLTRVTAEKERIGAELDVATKIQSDLLPSIFPPYPDRPEFDIYATMSPAREVGGDFYDFYFIDHDHIAMVAADVSGKGVPAALFMVIAKTLLKNQAQLEGPGASPAHILATVNDQLCENNDADMFVTVWLGILDIPAGRIRAANAGHENPFLRRADGTFEMVRDRHGLALAAMPGMRYRDYELQLEPGGGLFTYTDGVTEATSSREELFGTDRLLSALNEDPSARAKQVTQIVKARIDGFVQEAPQFDDITMLCLEYRGGSET